MAIFTVATTMKNEGPFILEWVAHYLTLGFDRIVVATNDCSDMTVRTLKRLEGLGYLRHHSTLIRSGGIQFSALRQLLRYEEVQTADWVFICDCDEFLNIHVGDGKVQDLVAVSGEDADVISIPWRVFGPNGRSAYTDEPVTQQFTMAELAHDPVDRPLTGQFVKSLFRWSEKFARVGVHSPLVKKDFADKVKWVLPGGAPYIVNGTRTANPPVWDVAQVNHYALRSLDSYLVKRDRGKVNHSHHVMGIDYWNKFNLNFQEDTTIRRYEAEKLARLNAFLADDALATPHRRSVRWHRMKAAEMRANPEIAEIVAEMERSLKPA